jgi:mRNA interferase HigB
MASQECDEPTHMLCSGYARSSIASAACPHKLETGPGFPSFLSGSFLLSFPPQRYRILRYSLLTDRIFAVTIHMDCLRGANGTEVWVIAKSHVRRFWECRKDDSEVAQRDLLTWFKMAESADWPNFGALKQTFGSADQVGNCVIFDVGNNRFRLIGRVFYAAGKLYVLKVMDHQEYDKGRWIDDCGCHEPPPLRPPRAKKSATPGAGAPHHRKRGR